MVLEVPAEMAQIQAASQVYQAVTATKMVPFSVVGDWLTGGLPHLLAQAHGVTTFNPPARLSTQLMVLKKMAIPSAASKIPSDRSGVILHSQKP